MDKVRVVVIGIFLVVFFAVFWAVSPMMAEAATWSEPYQASCYGPYEGETICATGKRITYSTKYVAVPMNRIVSKSTWKKMSSSKKKQYFYYHEKLTLKHGKKTCVVYVEDCGGFGSYGGYYKGKWRKRLFDLQPAVYKTLGIKGLGFVRFKY